MTEIETTMPDQLKEAIRQELAGNYGVGTDIYYIVMGIVREAEERLKNKLLTQQALWKQHSIIQ